MHRRIQSEKRLPRQIASEAALLEGHDVIWRAANDFAQLFNGEQCDILSLFDGVQRFVINAAFQQLILRDLLFFHGLPKRAIINHPNHRLVLTFS